MATKERRIFLEWVGEKERRDSREWSNEWGWWWNEKTV
jgi:hypothetical protein